MLFAAQLWHLIEASFNTPWNVDLLFDIRAQNFAVRHRNANAKAILMFTLFLLFFTVAAIALAGSDDYCYC